MSSATRFRLVLVTAPDLDAARRLARAALEARLVACANLIPGLESHYWWKGVIESAPEILILFKTVRAALPALEELVLRNHPYDTPEFVVLSLTSGNRRYLDWLGAGVSQ